MEVKEKMSAEDRRQILQTAINEKFPRDAIAFPNSPTPWVRDVFNESVVYELGGASFEVSYTMTEEGKVELGEETKKVIATTSYKSIEALREKYAELIQEAGERGVSGDSLREASEVCTTLIDAEEPDDEAVESALSGAEKALEWVKLQEASKTEDGQSFPAAAFAYTPDLEKPSTWKLRLWEDPEKKVTRRQLGAAAAAFSPGGFRGNRVQLPAAAVAGVKASIRAAYRRLGVATEDIPKWVKEVEMRERIGESCVVAIEEVTPKGIAAGILPVRIISPGFNSSESRHYSESAVADAGVIFDGSKMYADHATEAEEQAKPERSIRDWVATLQDTTVSEAGNAVGTAHIHAGWLKDMVTNLHEQGNLGQLGLSINCVGQGSKQTIEGKNTIAVESLERGTFGSVDFVTEAGASGEAGLKESARESLDVDLMDLAEFRTARPDLVTSIEAEVKDSLKQEVKEAMVMDTKVKDLEEQVDTLTTENGGLKATIDEAEKAKVKAEAQATIKEAVDKAELPDAAKTKLIARFADATSDDGVAEAIREEADYIATLLEKGKVKGLGQSETSDEAGKKALKESFMRGGMSEEKADDAVAGR